MNKSNLTFEEAREEHLERLQEIYNHYVAESTATFQIAPITAGEMRELIFFSNPRHRTFAIRTGSEVVGYVSAMQYKKREAYDDTAEISIYLDSRSTGKGIGAEAVKFIEDFCRESRFHALMAIICAENAGSISLFEKAGYFKCAHFREVGRKFGRLCDVVVYEKLIPEA